MPTRPLPPGSAPGDRGEDLEPRRACQADVLQLLRRYRIALELSAMPPPSRAGQGAMSRLLTGLRPTWGLHRMVVEHIRARIALVDRHFARRLALGERDASDEEDRQQLSLFDESLPPPRSRLWLALPLLAIVAVSQVLLALLQSSQRDLPSGPRTATQIAADEAADKQRAVPQDVLDQLTAAADLNPARFTETLQALLHSSPKASALAIGLLTLSVYLVWRPVLPAYRLQRIILDKPRAISRRISTEQATLGAWGKRLGLHGQELVLFARLEMRPPRESATDVWVKLALVAILAALAVLMFLPQTEPELGIFFAVVALGRLVWLTRELYLRRRCSATLYAEAEAEAEAMTDRRPGREAGAA